jgi:hypothetical protein
VVVIIGLLAWYVGRHLARRRRASQA